MTTPRFSIVMPVRDGEATFGWALESALRQTFDDYEIVVLDNNSGDRTPEIIAAHDDPRIRVFRNESTLPMPENFEKAWGLARGEHVLYLCDDDALLPTALSRIDRVIRDRAPDLVSWEYAFYYHPDWHTPEERNLLRIIPASGEVREESTAHLKHLVYSFKEPKWSPRMQNCCVLRKRFQEIREKYGRLFLAPCPDYAFLALTLDALDTLTAIHRPLQVAGRSSGSVGAVQATTLGDEARRFLEESGKSEILQSGPCGIPVIANFIAATLKNVEPMIVRAGGVPPRLDIDSCFLRAARNVRTIEQYVGSRADLRRALEESAAEYGDGTLEIVRSVFQVTSHRRKLFSRIADGVISRSRVLSRIEVAIRFSGDPSRARSPYDIEKGVAIRNNEVHVRGEPLGIGDILGATAIVDRLFETHAMPRSREM